MPTVSKGISPPIGVPPELKKNKSESLPVVFAFERLANALAEYCAPGVAAINRAT